MWAALLQILPVFVLDAFIGGIVAVGAKLGSWGISTCCHGISRFCPSAVTNFDIAGPPQAIFTGITS